MQKVKIEKSILPQWIRPEKEAVAAPKVEEPVTSKEVIAAPKIEEPVNPKVAVVTAPAITDKNLAQVNSNQSDWVEFLTGKMGNVTSYKKELLKKVTRNL